MPEWRVPLADVRVSEAEVAEVARTLRSGWLSMGPETERFETAFAAQAEARHALATANGTASLHLMLAASGVGPGDEVVVPSMSFVATANAVVYTGATPVFCDIDDVSRPWISAELAERLIGPHTKAILAMPYGGAPGDIAALAELAASRGVDLLIDAAHAIGARVGERPVAAWGRAAAFSFFSNKNLAIGEGGMVVTNVDELAERVRLLRSHGMTTLTWDRHRGHASTYDVVALGYNYRLDEPRAALGRARLSLVEDQDRQRAAAEDRYREALVDFVDLVPTAAPTPGSTSAHHLFTVVLEEHLDRATLRAKMADAGIQTSVHYPPIHHLSIYAAMASRLPTTEAYGRRTVTLPLFPHIPHDFRRLSLAFTLACGYVALVLVVLPDARAQALSLPLLALRVVLVIAGGVATTMLVLHSSDLNLRARRRDTGSQPQSGISFVEQEGNAPPLLVPNAQVVALDATDDARV